MPLPDDPFTRGKCAMKALQYMAVGTPVVCSPVGMNLEVIQENENGLLAADLDAWEAQIARLMRSIEQVWTNDKSAPLSVYAAGSEGPAEADALLARNGHHWRSLSANTSICDPTIQP